MTINKQPDRNCFKVMYTNENGETKYRCFSFGEGTGKKYEMSKSAEEAYAKAVEFENSVPISLCRRPKKQTVDVNFTCPGNVASRFEINIRHYAKQMDLTTDKRVLKKIKTALRDLNSCVAIAKKYIDALPEELDKEQAYKTLDDLLTSDNVYDAGNGYLLYCL